MDTTKRDPRVLPLPAAAPAPAVGAGQLGPFRVERELARGGMGIVYVAFHERPRGARAARTAARAVT